jgi:hypothetical protein
MKSISRNSLHTGGVAGSIPASPTRKSARTALVPGASRFLFSLRRGNLAGVIYERLYRARNDFLHGNPVTDETLRLERCRQSALHFAAPLFRLALTASAGEL